jgi:NAD+ kinase
MQNGKSLTERPVGVLHHPKKTESFGIADDICAWLAEHNIETWRGDVWDEESILPHIPETGFLLTLGGDGSMLRAARMSAGYDVPVLGVNMGRLGFLAEMTLEDWQSKLEKIIMGDYWLEPRMMLRTETHRDGDTLGSQIALNDVVISRGSMARVVRVRVEVDGESFTTYVADGIIISTPTGSTAYALAAGGPILPPELRNILMLPIAPHLTLDRSVVLAEGAHITIHPHTDQQAILTVDGQVVFELNANDRIEVRSSDHTSHFIRLGNRNYFYKTLLERLEPKQTDAVDWK